MSEFEPPILVIPNSQREILKYLVIVIEYLQEDFAGEVVDCHRPARRPVLIFRVDERTNVSFQRNVSQLNSNNLNLLDIRLCEKRLGCSESHATYMQQW